MRHGLVVDWLLENDWKPEDDGYTLVSSTVAGDYLLKLWQGAAHVDGKPVKFVEMSFNRKGLNFDKETQNTVQPGSIHALGHRRELLATVGQWLARFKVLYVGSHDLKKLGFYHRLLRNYLGSSKVSAPYPAFDESNGVPEYFTITAGDSVAESVEDELDGPEGHLDRIPSYVATLRSNIASRLDSEFSRGHVNSDNFMEVAEDAVDDVVNKYLQTTGPEMHVDEDAYARLYCGLAAWSVHYAEELLR